MYGIEIVCRVGNGATKAQFKMYIAVWEAASHVHSMYGYNETSVHMVSDNYTTASNYRTHVHLTTTCLILSTEMINRIRTIDRSSYDA